MLFAETRGTPSNIAGLAGWLWPAWWLALAASILAYVLMFMIVEGSWQSHELCTFRCIIAAAIRFAAYAAFVGLLLCGCLELIHLGSPCVLSEWSAWSECDASDSQHIRTRGVVSSGGYGRVCNSSRMESSSCTARVVISDCVVSAWSAWSACDAATEARQRSRGINTHPSKTGEPCPSLHESSPCSVDCVVSAWSAWSACDAATEQHQRSRGISTHPSETGKPCPSLHESSDSSPCRTDCVVSAWSAWSACDAATEDQLRSRCVDTHPSKTGKQCPPTQETSSCTISCVVSAWSAWSACESESGQQLRTRAVIEKPSETGSACPELQEASTCAVDCALSGWQPWGSCSASCDGGQSSRFRAVTVQPHNGGSGCGALTETEACAQIRCYHIALNGTLHQDCQIKDASELHKALRILLHAGVTDTSDMCLLQVKDLQGNLNGPPLPHLLLASHYESESESASDSAAALLPVTMAKLVRCICTKLCDSADAPLCQKSVDTHPPEHEAELVKWLRETCKISSGVKEIVDGLQALGVERESDLRQVTEEMVNSLVGVPIIRREKLVGCLRDLPRSRSDL